MSYEIKVYEKTGNKETIHNIHAEKIVFNKNGGIDIFITGESTPVFPCLEKNVVEVSVRIF